LRIKVKEHRNNIKLDESKNSVISEHMLSCNHSFDWNQVRILDIEPNYNKRLIYRRRCSLKNSLTALIHKKILNF